MDTKKINQMIRIAKMHYELNYTQLEIAAKEGISKATVSRILKSAMDLGIIEVRIKDSILNDTTLEHELIAAYPLKRAVIVPDLVGNEQILLQDVCAALVEDLPRYVKNDSVLGVFYGHTLTVLARQLPRIRRKNVSVIQLAGGFARAMYESNSLSILRSFADCFGGTPYQIPAPAMVEKPFIVDALKQDSQIAKVINMADVCDTAVFSVGNLERPSVLYEMGLIPDEEYRAMIKKGFIGDCCSHFLNKEGEIFDPVMDSRVVGVSLDTIKKIPNKLLVVSGKKKDRRYPRCLKRWPCRQPLHRRPDRPGTAQIAPSAPGTGAHPVESFDSLVEQFGTPEDAALACYKNAGDDLLLRRLF